MKMEDIRMQSRINQKEIALRNTTASHCVKPKLLLASSSAKRKTVKGFFIVIELLHVAVDGGFQ